MGQRERVELEIYNLRRKVDQCLQVGNTEEVSRILITISKLQEIHGVTSGIRRELDMEQEITIEQPKFEQDTAIQSACEKLRGTVEAAFDLLVKRRDSAYSQAVAGLDSERESLEKESVALKESERNLGEVIPAKMRVAQAEADALLLSGRIAEAHRKIAEAQEAEHAPEVMSERQRAIRERLEAIEAEKRHAARRVFSEWHRECITVHRSIENAHFVLFLDALKQSFFDFEQSTGTFAQKVGDPGLFTVGLLDTLTADERSAEWQSGFRWYSGRERR
jgi:hypothetical protein